MSAVSRAAGRLLNIGQQRQVFVDVARSRGFDPLVANCWYQISADEFIQSHKDIKSILHAYRHNLVNALLRIFPNIGLEKDRLISSVVTVSLEEKRRLILELARKLGYSTAYDDLYKLNSQKFRHNGLRYLILPYKDSAVKLISSSFPEHVWHEWLFEHPPAQLWLDKETHKKYVTWLEDKLEITEMSGWYNVTWKDVHQNRGKSLLSVHYGDSLSALLQAVYPSHPWLCWLFRDGVGVDYWKSSDNCQRYFDWLGKKLGFTQQDDWYSITNKDVEENQGKSLLELYKGSAAQAIMATYNTYNWDANKMKALRRSLDFIKQTDVLSVLEQVAAKVNLQRKEEWYVVSRADLFSVPFGKRLYKHYEQNMLKILQVAYPSHDWDASKFVRNAKNKRQFLLEKMVRELFVGQTILTNARKATQMKYTHGNNPYMELDIYIPALQLAFEYQDPHHYFFVWYANKPLDVYQMRDTQKVQAASSRGITLIHIPFWWDRTKESLIGTIQKVRGELLPQYSMTSYLPIPTEPPSDCAAAVLKDYYVPGIGVPMLASPLLSLEGFGGVNWWIIEKYDGIRAFWSPVDCQLVSRSGRKLHVPADILTETFMPINFWVDGEIWFGYGNFDEASKIAHKAAQIDWLKFKYVAFDAPTYIGTYKERYTFLQSKLHSLPRVIVPHYSEWASTSKMLQFTQEIIDKGGEGIILRNSTSFYTPGRSKEFLKLKKYRDAEAKVMAIEKDLYTCELPSGAIFSAPLELTFKKKETIQKGSIVSFKHRGFSQSGKPKLPIIYRIRTDVLWEDLQASSHFKPKSSFNEYAPYLHRVIDRKPLGFWNDLTNVKNWFDNIVKSKGLDSLNSTTWNITLADLRSTKVCIINLIV